MDRAAHSDAGDLPDLRRLRVCRRTAAGATPADAVLAHFARPRCIEILDALPQTRTQKLRKQELRTRAVTS